MCNAHTQPHPKPNKQTPKNQTPTYLFYPKNKNRLCPTNKTLGAFKKKALLKNI